MSIKDTVIEMFSERPMSPEIPKWAPKTCITDSIEIKDLSDDAFISDCLKSCKNGRKSTLPRHRTSSFPVQIKSEAERLHPKLGNICIKCTSGSFGYAVYNILFLRTIFLTKHINFKKTFDQIVAFEMHKLHFRPTFSYFSEIF